MAGSDINIKMKLDGESEFRRSIKDCNAEMKNMQSALKLADAEAKAQGNSIESLTKKQEALNNVLETSAKKEDALNAALENARSNQEQMAKQLDEAKAAYGENSKEVEKAQQAYDNATNKVNDWERQLNNAKVEAINYKSALEENTTAIDNYGKETEEAADDTDHLLDVMGKTAAMEAVKELAGEISGAFQKLGQAAYDAMIELDAGYDTIITKTGATGEALANLERSANNVYGSMPTSMDAVSQAIGEVNTRFGLTDEALERTSGLFIQFAEINGSDVTGSIDQVDRILTQYGEDLSSIEGFLGQVTKASQDTGKSTGDFLSQLDQNASLLKTFGIDLEEAVNLFARFEDNGIQASTALQGMKKAAANYAKEGDDMRTGLEKTIKAIRDASDKTEAYAIAQETFGNRGFTAMADAIREGRFSLDDLADSFENYTDTVESTYKETKNAWDEWTTAQNNLKIAGSELSGEFYQALTPAIETITGVVQDATAKFQDLPEPMQTVLGIAGGLVTEAGNLAPKLFEVGTQLATLKAARDAAASLQGVSGAASSSSGALAKLSTALSGIGGPVVLAAIGAVIAGFVLAKTSVDNLRQDVDEFVSDVTYSGSQITSAMEVYKSSIEGASKGADKFKTASEGLKKAQDSEKKASSDAAKAQAQIKSAYEDSLEAVRNTDSATVKFTALLAGEGAVAAGEMGDSVKKLNAAYDTATESVDEARAAEVEFQNAQRDAILEMNEGNDVTYNAASNTLALAESLGRTSGEYSNVTEALGNLTIAHQEQVAQINAEIQSIEQEMQDLQAEYDAAYQSAYDSLSGQFGLFEQVQVEATTSVAEMNAALESQMQFMTDYGTNLKKAAEMGVSEGLIKQLSDGSVESAQYLQAIVDSGGEGIEQLNANFQKVENGKQTMSKIMAENVTDFSNKMSALETRMDSAVSRLNKADAAYVSGAQTIQGYIRGAEAYRSSIIAEFTSLAQAANDAYKRTLDQHSPSRVMYRNARDTVEGLILGAESKKGDLANTFESLTLATAAAMDPASLTSNISNYAGATTLNNQVAVYIGDKELTGYLATGVIKAISDNARNGYAGRRV